MKVAFLINTFHQGGAERLVKDLAAEMKQMTEVHPVVIVAKGEGELQSEYKTSDISTYSLDVDIYSVTIPQAIRKLSTIMSETNPDLVHSHISFSHTVSRIVCARQNVPHVATYHNVRDHKPLPKRLAERTMHGLSKRIICVSEGVRQSYSNINNMDVIYNAIDVDGFNELVLAADTGALESQICDNKTIFLNVARCVEQKRQKDLIEAMTHLRDDDIHLFIVGDGPQREKLEKLVHEKSLEDKVTITGFVEAIEPYYAIADGFVSSSANEGLPTTHIEAMAAKLPIISTDIPGVKEIVIHGENGYLSPVSDPTALADNILKAKEKNTMGERGYKLALERFSLEEITKRHCDLYNEIYNR